MKVLLDTNVLIAAFAGHGACSELVEDCAKNHEVFYSSFIVSEFRDKPIRKLGFTPEKVLDAVLVIESRFKKVTHDPPRRRICRDSDDDNIIAAAVAAHCDCIVSGDQDLLELIEVEGVRVISPSQFWGYEFRWGTSG